ncbi:preprotein translocase subunit SecG [Xinfangfangia sp. CPCC 101601]|uniref:Protein-export membrane protein SecG n=1 Tax=Pseudogemmobacter lacusdianii TaxID=3069608 RepID=A0ABU0VVH7_9RHOB|nr:preprotein translocase subunit SecG [Xinfangfangia sp. CPCC 101601]MDQ2065754.1 preprotein translocase subunit SecG [Xinfangfangia sp. CPCC 101601]
METVVLTVHLILALLLIGVVLLQRNEGGALLSGGGSTQARGKATGLTKLTWVFAIAFICTSMTLAVMAARDAGGGSVLDLVPPPAAPADGTSAPAEIDSLLPPAPADEALIPPAVTAPAADETAAPATGSN